MNSNGGWDEPGSDERGCKGKTAVFYQTLEQFAQTHGFPATEKFLSAEANREELLAEIIEHLCRKTDY